MEYYLSYNQSEIDIDQTSEESGWVSNSSETPDALHSDEDDERVIEGISSSDEEERGAKENALKDSVLLKELTQRKKANGLQLFLQTQPASAMVVPPPKEFQDHGTTTTTISPPSADDLVPPMTNLAPLCPPEEFRDLDDDLVDQSSVQEVDKPEQDKQRSSSNCNSRQNSFPLKPKKFSSLQYRKHGSVSTQSPAVQIGSSATSTGGGGVTTPSNLSPSPSGVGLSSQATAATTPKNSQRTNGPSTNLTRRGSLDCNCLLADQKILAAQSQQSVISSNVPTTPQQQPNLAQPNFQTIPYFLIPDELRVFHPKGLHLIICVHGLDGSCHDLRLFKIYLEVSLPGQNIHFLMSEKNQDGLTFSDFSQMTDKFVAEILAYMDTNKLNPTRISFVGHSLGNIIIRSALTRPGLAHLLPKLHTFLSLSGPHLGTLYNGSGLVNMGKP